MILGIDPGTACGYAVLDEDGKRIASGTWHLQRKRKEDDGWRVIRLGGYLRRAFDDHGIMRLAYEDVRHHAGVIAAHVYGELTGQIKAECVRFNVEYRKIGVQKIKAAATGKGVADKQSMIDAANARWNHECEDDNEADALWCAETARRELWG